MASIVDPSLVSNPEEHKWVAEIDEILNVQLSLKIETPSISFFQVPETITTKKPEAYEPQQVGLGPIHHFQPKLYKKSEQKKFSVVQKVLKDHEIKDYHLMVLDNVRNVIPIIRSCYDMFLQASDDTLARVFAIDGIFLLNLFHMCNSQMSENNTEENSKSAVYVYRPISLLPTVVVQETSIIELDQIITSDVVHSGNNIEENSASDGFRPLNLVLIVVNESLTEEPDQTTSSHAVHPANNTEKNMEAELEIEVTSEEENQLISRSGVVNPGSEIVIIRESGVYEQRSDRLDQVHTIDSEPTPHLLQHQPEPPKVDQKRRSIAQDVMMVENQIPFMVLKEIEESLHPSSGNSSYSTDKFSPSIYRTFCEIHSPLELCSMSRAPTSVDHLLHYMYHSVVNNVFEQQQYQLMSHSIDSFPISVSYNANEHIDLVSNVYNFVAKIPQKEIVQAYEQTVFVLETFSQSKILIPSASRLHEKGYCFCRLEKYEGIQNINIYGKDIYLPCVTLYTDSEVILRNLVAYETLITKSDDFPLTEYVALMCALIVKVEDVKLLKKQNVIRGDLGDAEVAKLFIGLSTSMPAMRGKGKSRLQEVIDNINKVYERRLRVKMYLRLKKVAGWLLVVLKAIGSFVESSWKIVAFMVSIVTVFCLTWQAYCESFGCVKTTLTLLPYSSS